MNEASRPASAESARRQVCRSAVRMARTEAFQRLWEWDTPRTNQNYKDQASHVCALLREPQSVRLVTGYRGSTGVGGETFG